MPYPFRRTRVAAAVVAFSLAAPSLGDEPARKSPEEPAPKPAAAAADRADPPVVTRVYDVSDLLLDVPDFTDAPNLRDDGRPGQDAQPRPQGGGGGGGGGLFNNAAAAADARPRGQRVDDLVKLIEETVDPGSWRDNGGRVGSVREVNGGLVVSQTEENHRAVLDVLAQLRKRVAVPVRVRAHWVLADRTEIEKVLAPAAGDGKAAAGDKAAPGGPAALLAAEPAALAKLPAVARFGGEVVFTVGQRVHVSATEVRGVAVAVVPSVGEGAAAVAPQTERLGRGLVLDVQATLVDERRSAVLTLRNQWKDLRVEPGRGAAAYGVATTRPSLPNFTATADAFAGRLQELNTTVRLPLGRTVLIGGMTADPTTPAAAPADPSAGGAPQAGPGNAAAPAGPADRPQLYLFVEVTAG